jgi:hypothetical protein
MARRPRGADLRGVSVGRGHAPDAGAHDSMARRPRGADLREVSVGRGHASDARSRDVHAFEPGRLIEYSHWSSLSRRVMADSPETHVSIRFALLPVDAATRLERALGNLFDPAVRGHLGFHWDVTLPVLKRFCEETG